MNNRGGFTLIEVMVALACMIGVLSLTTQLSMTLYATWKKTAQSVQTRMALHAALDVLRRDLEHVSCEHAQWYVAGPHELVWHDVVSSHDVRICVVKGRLERCEGSYDKRTHEWHSRSVSVLAQDIKELRCIVHESVTHGSAARGKYGAVAVTVLTNNGFEERELIALGLGTLS
jgi:prepilin-type N-terminal cleavage/methylation domain-containing protein